MTVIEQVGSQLYWLAAPVLLIAVTTQAWNAYRARRREIGLILPTTGQVVATSLRTLLRDETPFWKLIHLLTVLATIAALTIPPAAIGVYGLALPLIIIFRLVYIAGRRQPHVAGAYELATQILSLPKPTKNKPVNWRNHVRIHKWHQATTPIDVSIHYTGYTSVEEEKTRTKFEERWRATFSNDVVDWDIEWDTNAQAVHCKPIPPLPKLVDYQPIQSPWNEFPIGVGRKGIVKWDILKVPHSLIAGPTGTGKSVAQRVLIAHALLHPDQWVIFGVDPKSTELGWLRGRKNVAKVAVHLDDCQGVIEGAYREMKRRQMLMEQAGQTGGDFREIKPNPPKAVLVVVDEATELLTPSKGKTDEAKEEDEAKQHMSLRIQQIARLGRAFGIYLLLATQRPDANTFPGALKALALDTPVLTTDGWSRMEKLKVGDQVFDENGQPCAITATSPVYGDNDCYRLTFSDGATLVADGGHLWQTTSRRQRQWGQQRRRLGHEDGNDFTSVVTTAEIATTVRVDEGRANHAVAVAAPIQHPHRDLPIDPYTLGAWLGDGSSTAAQITTIDPEILNEIGNAGYTIVKYAREHRYGITDGLRGKLVEHRLWGNKHIPDEYMLASERQRRDLLAGLLDTDGTVSRGGAVMFSQTDDRLAHQVLELIWSLGYKATLGTYRIKKPSGEWSHTNQVRFTPHDNVFRLPRKAERLKAAGGGTRRTQRLRYITDVTPIASVPVRCISVDSPSRLFLVGHELIPTHNSNCEMRFAAGRMSQVHSQMVMDSTEAMDLPNIKGRGLLKLGRDTELLQTFFLDPARIDEIFGAPAATPPGGGGGGGGTISKQTRLVDAGNQPARRALPEPAPAARAKAKPTPPRQPDPGPPGMEHLHDEPAAPPVRPARPAPASAAAPPPAAPVQPTGPQQRPPVAHAQPRSTGRAQPFGDPGDGKAKRVPPQPTGEVDEDALQLVLEELDSLPGMRQVAAQVRKLAHRIRLDARRRAEGKRSMQTGMHLAFTGPPGTGKTTVARLIARMYHALGMLGTSNLVEVDRSGLVGKYQGHTADKTNETFDEALGGVLFIDEAYALVQDGGSGSGDTFGKEAVATIIKRMEDDRDQVAVVLAGYPDEMEAFFESNSGFKSRISKTIEFDSYDARTLVGIGVRILQDADYVITQDAKFLLLGGLERAVADADRNWGNAREVRRLLDEAMTAQATRLAEMVERGEEPSSHQLSEITVRDIVDALRTRGFDLDSPLPSAVEPLDGEPVDAPEWLRRHAAATVRWPYLMLSVPIHHVFVVVDVPLERLHAAAAGDTPFVLPQVHGTDTERYAIAVPADWLDGVKAATATMDQAKMYDGGTVGMLYDPVTGIVAMPISALPMHNSRGTVDAVVEGWIDGTLAANGYLTVPDIGDVVMAQAGTSQVKVLRRPQGVAAVNGDVIHVRPCVGREVDDDQIRELLGVVAA